jgi:peroxiredoxin
MAQFEPMKSKINRTGASMVFIAAQRRGGLFSPENYFAEHPISYLFLLDENRAVTKAYGVYHRIGLDAYDIARPATFVIGADSRVKYLYVGSSQTDRAPIQDVLSSVRSSSIGARS